MNTKGASLNPFVYFYFLVPGDRIPQICPLPCWNQIITPSGHTTWNTAMHRRSDQQMQKLDMLANIYGFWKLQLPRAVFHMMGNQSQVKILAKFPNISGFLKAVEGGRQSSGTESTQDQASHIPRVTANRCGLRASPGWTTQLPRGHPCQRMSTILLSHFILFRSDYIYSFDL